MILGARINLNDIYHRLSVIPTQMDVGVSLEIVIDCGDGCEVITTTMDEAAAFINLAIKDHAASRKTVDTSADPEAVAAVEP